MQKYFADATLDFPSLKSQSYRYKNISSSITSSIFLFAALFFSSRLQTFILHGNFIYFQIWRSAALSRGKTRADSSSALSARADFIDI